MNKIDKFADHLCRNKDDAAEFMASLSLIRDGVVQRALKQHVKRSHPVDSPLPWSKILHDIYIELVNRGEAKKRAEEHLDERRKSGKKMGFLDAWIQASIDRD